MDLAYFGRIIALVKSGAGSWYAFTAHDLTKAFQLSAWFGRKPIAEQKILSKIERLSAKVAGARASARQPEISTWPSHRNTFVGEAVG